MFLWFHVRHINALKEHPEKILKIDREISCNLNYDRIEFPIEEKDLTRLKYKIIFALMCLVMKMS